MSPLFPERPPSFFSQSEVTVIEMIYGFQLLINRGDVPPVSIINFLSDSLKSIKGRCSATPQFSQACKTLTIAYNLLGLDGKSVVQERVLDEDENPSALDPSRWSH